MQRFTYSSGALKSVFWAAARPTGVWRGRRKSRAAPVAEKRVELNRWHGFPLYVLIDGGTVPAPSRAVGERLGTLLLARTLFGQGLLELSGRPRTSFAHIKGYFRKE